jgi:hypothetical protein
MKIPKAKIGKKMTLETPGPGSYRAQSDFGYYELNSPFNGKLGSARSTVRSNKSSITRESKEIKSARGQSVEKE